jgi:hypothetical protein
MSQFDFKANAITTGDVGDKTTTTTTVNSTKMTITVEGLGAQAGLTPVEIDLVQKQIELLIEAHEQKDSERMTEALYEMGTKLGKKAWKLAVAFFTGV